MDAILYHTNEYFYSLHWIVVTVAILFAYALINGIVKLFTRVDEEMWERY